MSNTLQTEILQLLKHCKVCDTSEANFKKKLRSLCCSSLCWMAGTKCLIAETGVFDFKKLQDRFFALSITLGIANNKNIRKWNVCLRKDKQARATLASGLKLPMFSNRVNNRGREVYYSETEFRRVITSSIHFFVHLSQLSDRLGRENKLNKDELSECAFLADPLFRSAPSRALRESSELHHMSASTISLRDDPKMGCDVDTTFSNVLSFSDVSSVIVAKALLNVQTKSFPSFHLYSSLVGAKEIIGENVFKQGYLSTNVGASSLSLHSRICALGTGTTLNYNIAATKFLLASTLSSTRFVVCIAFSKFGRKLLQCIKKQSGLDNCFVLSPSEFMETCWISNFPITIIVFNDIKATLEVSTFCIQLEAMINARLVTVDAVLRIQNPCIECLDVPEALRTKLHQWLSPKCNNEDRECYEIRDGLAIFCFTFTTVYASNAQYAHNVVRMMEGVRFLRIQPLQQRGSIRSTASADSFVFHEQRSNVRHLMLCLTSILENYGAKAREESKKDMERNWALLVQKSDVQTHMLRFCKAHGCEKVLDLPETARKELSESMLNNLKKMQELWVTKFDNFGEIVFTFRDYIITICSHNDVKVVGDEDDFSIIALYIIARDFTSFLFKNI